MKSARDAIPRATSLGLARAAMRAGAEIYEHARVNCIERDSRQGDLGWKISTSARHTLGARSVRGHERVYERGNAVTAKENHSDRVVHHHDRSVAESAGARTQPAQPDDLRFQKLSLLLPPDSGRKHAVRRARRIFSRRTIRRSRRSADILRRGMIDVYPQLRDARIEYVWGGTLDFAFDIMPHAGQMDGMYYAVGYAGHGVAMATYQGQKMAEMMAGDKAENPFVGIPFPGAPLGLYNGRPWFLPFAGAWYKVLDWMS